MKFHYNCFPIPSPIFNRICNKVTWSDIKTLLNSTDMPPRIALHQAQKSLDHYRSTLKDQWNFHGLTSSENYGLDGLPWATSHYSFQLMLWHLPLALSGQQYNAPNATLSFKPKFDVPYWLSFYTPVALGNIEAKFNEASNETMFKFTVSSGEKASLPPLYYLLYTVFVRG